MQNRAMKEQDESQVEGRVTYCKALRCEAVSRWRKWTTGFVTVDFHFSFGFIFSPFLSSQVIECNDNALQRLLNTSIRAFGYFWEHEMLFIVYGFGINRKKTPVLLRFEMCRINFVCMCAPDIVHTCDLESRSALRFSLLFLMLSLLSLLNINSLFLRPHLKCVIVSC